MHRYNIPTERRRWNWFASEYERLPLQFRPYAVGITPLNGIMLSDRCLSAVADVVNSPEMARVYSELRLPTAIHAAGFDIATMDWPTNVWKAKTFDYKRPGIFHPVKCLGSASKQ